MSDNNHTIAPRPADRRARKTLAALRTAFSQLFLEKGLDGISVGDIVSHADVARSTFYKYYSSKEDILCAVMAPILAPIADCVDNDALPARLEAVTAHLWEHRQFARAIFAEPAKTTVTRLLADLIEGKLRKTQADGVPLRLITVMLSATAFGMIEEWLSGRYKCSPADIARTLHSSVLGASRGAFQRDAAGA